MDKLLSDKVGDKIFVLGNEAIVRGALEAGISVASTYPGTPSSEIGDTFFRIAKDAGVYYEYSVNEKVALEVSGAAAVSGLRALAFMKHVGLNVAADAFVTLGYTGVRGGLVVISADDPSLHSSQNEQDNRYYSKLANLPMLEPSGPQEAKEMIKHGFELSHELELPILFRTTTRINHVRGPITLGEMRKPEGKKDFEKDPFRFVVVPGVARRRHKVLLEKMEIAKEKSEKSELNFVEEIGDAEKAEFGIVTSGVSYTYVKEVAEKTGLNAKLLKLGMTNPLPEKKCIEFMKSVEKVIVVEELEPYLEDGLRAIANSNQLQKEILGKRHGLFPRLYELNLDLVRSGIFTAMGLEEPKIQVNESRFQLPSRVPTLCSACPHRAAYFAAKKASKGEAVYSMDIGCYTLGLQEPLVMADLLICMGSSIGAACGFSKSINQKVMAFIGDSTFFHAGMPGLINAVHNKHDFVLVVMDNSTTAMTGHQPHPGIPLDGWGDPAPQLSIEDLVRGCGIDFVEVVDPYEVKKTTDLMKKALDHEGIAVIITKHPCALIELRDKRRAGVKVKPYQVDPEKCKKCLICVNQFACPAFYMEGEKPKINDPLCYGCGVCAQICPHDAIEVVE